MSERVDTSCCIVGGGPAGMMLAFLLARAGVDVVVMEKHADFFRDFRGDTIHPSTLQLMYELGLLPQFLQLPHHKLHKITARIGGATVPVGDFSRLPVQCPYIAIMPQWDFLNFLADQGKRYPAFRLMMQTEGADLIEESDSVVGVRAKSPQGEIEVRAPLVVACDGRHSTIRACAKLAVENLGASMDVLWFRLRYDPNDPYDGFGYMSAGSILVTINRGDYWQCAYVIPKGSFDALREQGLDHFRNRILQIQPRFQDRIAEIADWDSVKLLEVRVDRLKRWHKPGLLLIGDAAHAMSPIGGVGVNLAIQDAVAAANALAAPLCSRAVSEDVLSQIQRRRELPTVITQRIQIFVQNMVIGKILATHGKTMTPPSFVKLLTMFPALQRIPAQLVGIGIRPEHVRTPAAV